MNITDTVLMYAPPKSKRALRMKPAIIRTGAKIKMVTNEQFGMKIGELLGLSLEEIDEIALSAQVTDGAAGHDVEQNSEELEQLSNLNEEVLVLWNFSSSKIDGMLSNFRKAGVSKVNLKAIVTPNNIKWSFAHLVRELQREHEAYNQ